jgi:hypothetical protein
MIPLIPHIEFASPVARHGSMKNPKINAHRASAFRAVCCEAA